MKKLGSHHSSYSYWHCAEYVNLSLSCRFSLTDDDRKIALYAGAVTSAFTFAEFTTGVFWGRMSDKFGRKPVLIIGLLGTAISMIAFGFASSLPIALLARALGGLLNGNIGVLQTTVAELVTKKEHQPRAYSIMPFVWCLGSIVGPAMGGALAQPCDNYPRLFPRNTIFDRYPFLLPNLVCVVILCFGITIGILFLQETHPEKKFHRDRGIELGRWLLGVFYTRPIPAQTPGVEFKAPIQPDEIHVLADHQQLPPGYRSIESSPRLISVKVPGGNFNIDPPSKQSRAFVKVFTPRVTFVILSYGILAYHSVSFDQLMPIFLSTPISDVKAELPFKFNGGMAMSTKKIGFMLAVQGFYSMLAQLWFFPYVVGYFGTLSTYRFVLCIWPALYLVVPYLVLLPGGLQIPAVYAVLIAKITLHVIAFPSTNILLANSAPCTTVLGAINGVAASTASLSRAFGPTVTGYLHSKGLEWGYSGLSWWACGIVCFFGAVESFWIGEDERRETIRSEKICTDECDDGLYDEREAFLPRESSVEHLTSLLVRASGNSRLKHECIANSQSSLDDIETLNLDLDASKSPYSRGTII
ncbi:conserved hypothetical protein [Histoplasma capsulatum G186AR]|uniref:Major facilitator superfamily (MFS) profile domain-containing protein n=1 Tax=Ajellomyces capsulatus (strain G186AR / H82 / ATCC MYA-2454 / RMSCC 2432) TaxID=447093 RepID=C0NL14_AJECG|nr:uncharacterized protein HCBG_03844 [Histoplasma capsulatum G186AR]EEH08555.1 conserved hypothetical protein [Histoplasma capsulatum G186AR]